MSKKDASRRFPFELAALQREMATLTEETLGRRFRAPKQPGMFRWSPEWLREWTRIPFVDVYEEADEVIVKIEVPGMDEGDIELTVTGDTLTILGEKKKEEKTETKEYYYNERSEGKVSRSLDLPSEVVPDKVTAVLKNGVLEIRLPKAEGAKRKEIKVKVG